MCEAAPLGPQLGLCVNGAVLTLIWHILPKVSDATGQMHLTKVANSSPFAVELLIPDDCFVLDNGLCGKIYIWKGTSDVSRPGRGRPALTPQASHWRTRQPPASTEPPDPILWAGLQAPVFSFLFPPLILKLEHPSGLLEG